MFLLKRKFALLLICLATFCFSCNKKYILLNNYPEEVDVSEYVKSGEFLPDSCNGRLVSLLKKHPYQFKEEDEAAIKELFDKWSRNYNGSLQKQNCPKVDFDESSLYQKMEYLYTYFPLSDPEHVYRLTYHIPPNGSRHSGELRLFFRVNEKNKIENCTDQPWLAESNCGDRYVWK